MNVASFFFIPSTVFQQSLPPAASLLLKEGWKEERYTDKWTAEDEQVQTGKGGKNVQNHEQEDILEE